MASATQNFLNSNSLFNNHNNIFLGVNYVKDPSSWLVAEPGLSFLIDYNSIKNIVKLKRGVMECSICKEEVYCLNNTSEGESCYNCRKRLGLKILDFPFSKTLSQKEIKEEMKRKNG